MQKICTTICKLSGETCNTDLCGMKNNICLKNGNWINRKYHFLSIQIKLVKHKLTKCLFSWTSSFGKQNFAVQTETSFYRCRSINCKSINSGQAIKLRQRSRIALPEISNLTDFSLQVFNSVHIIRHGRKVEFSRQIAGKDFLAKWDGVKPGNTKVAFFSKLQAGFRVEILNISQKL